MEDPNDEEWRIDKSRGRLRQILNTGLTLGKRIAFTGILVSTAPLTLPPLVVLSAFGVAFSLPSGFYIASYAATDKIMRALLNNPDPPPLLIQYEDREQEKAYMYNDDKVDEEGYEEDCDLEEGEMELEGDTSLPFKMRIDLDEENDKIQVDSEFAVDVSSRRLEIDEAVKDVGGLIVEKFEQDGYEADVGEYTEKEETIPSIASETPSMEEGRGEVVFVPQVSMEDIRCMVKFGDVELQELEKDTTGMIQSIRDKGISETEELEHSVEKEEQSLSIAFEILRGIGETEEMSFLEEGNHTEEAVVSADLGGENDVDVQQVEEVNVHGPRVSMESSSLQVNFGDVELKEIERETIGMIESLRDEGISQSKTHGEHLVEKEETICNASSEIPEGIKQAEEDISLTDKLQIGAVVAVMSAEVGGENDIYIEQMKRQERDKDVNEATSHEILVETEESIPSIASEILLGIEEAEEEIPLLVEEAVFSADAVGGNDIIAEQVEDFLPGVSMEDNSPEVKFGYVELEELEREMTPMNESISDEGTSETKNHEHSIKKASPLLPDEIIQQAFVPSVSLQKDSEPLKRKFGEDENENEDRRRLSAEKTSQPPQIYREELGIVDNLEQLIVPSEEESVDTIAVLQEHSIIVSTTQDSRREDVAISAKEEIQETRHKGKVQMEGEEGETRSRVRKLVVHVNKSCDSNISRAMGETRSLILKRVDRHPRSTDDHPEGIYRSSDDIQDSTSTKLMEAGLWKQMNAMRTIVGYESPPHASCVEELKALYLFTGVEPPASLNEPLSIDDVSVHLMFLMAVVGVKEM